MELTPREKDKLLIFTAAVFAVTMLLGRTAGSALVSRFAAARLYAAALLVNLLGFALMTNSLALAQHRRRPPLDLAA